MKTKKRYLVILIALLLGLLGRGRANAQTASWNGTQTSGTYWLDSDINLSHSFTLEGNLTLVSTGTHTIKNNVGWWMFGTGSHKLTIRTENANDTVYIDGGSVFEDNDARKTCTTQGSQGNLIWIANNGSIDLSNVVLQNVNNTDAYRWGGAIASDARTEGTPTSIVLTNCKIRACYTETGGSAIFFDNSELHNVTLTNVEIYKCKSETGGTIHTATGGVDVALTIKGGKIHDNESGLYGGGICWFAGRSNNSKLIIKEGTKIYNNIARNNGGGIFGSGYIDIQNAEIYDNQATGEAGIPFDYDQPQYIGSSGGVAQYSTTLTTLYSKGCGGGIFIYPYSGTHTAGMSWHYTSAENYNGQGIYFRVGSNVSIHHNTAANKGGGICIELFGNDFTGYENNNSNNAVYTGSATPYWINPFYICDAMVSGTLYENSAPQGGGAYIRDYCPKWYRHTKAIAEDPQYHQTSPGWTGLLIRNIVFNGATIRNNHATTDDGGGVYVLKSIRMKTETVSSNNWEAAHTFCYGWYNNGTSTGWNSNWGSDLTSVWFRNGTKIYENDAIQYGAGVFVNDNTHDLYQTFPSNHHCKVHLNDAIIRDNVCGNHGGGMHLHTAELDIDGNSTITGNRVSTNGKLGGGIYFAPATATGAEAGTLTSTMNLGTASMTVKGNTANTIPNNIYLPTSMTMYMDESHTFTPIYVGVYTQGDEDQIPIISGYVSGVSDGLTKIHDDKQKYVVTKPDIYYFSTGTPWSPLQQTARDSDLVDSDGDEYYEIGNVKQLTAFLWKVNGIHTYETSYTSSVSNLKGKLTANIDMTDHYWVPIANYTGTFDGNGYIISNLSMVPTNASAERGLFGVNSSGTIKNVNLRDCYFASAGSYMGSIVSQMNGGTLSNSVAQCQLTATANTCKAGGLVGHINGGTVHSSIATCEMTGYTMGGLVGQLSSGNLYNSYAYTKFDHKGGSTYFGGLAAENTGTIENCYVRLQGSAPSGNFGWLVGNNTGGTINYSYSPNATYTVSGQGGTQDGLSTFGVTATNAYNYRVRDNQVAATNTYAPTYDEHHLADYQLKKYLNKWVDTKNGSSSTYAGWTRPTTQAINGDYPLLKLHGFNAVAATSGEISLDYGDINTLLTDYATADNSILFYGSKEGMNSNSGSAAPLYIDEDAVLTPSTAGGDIVAHVGVTIDNSACHAGANPSFAAQGYTDYIDWHFFSSALKDSPIGLHYGAAGETEDTEQYQAYVYPSWNATFTNANGYFPLNLNDYYVDWDLYAYCEPDYHWINLKRNSASHWHEDYPGINIPYTNDTEFVPGKGYMVALKEEGYLQAYGTLNTNTGSGSDFIEVPLSYTSDISWTTRQGHNLLGNPYQSYLDFDLFAEYNKGLWGNDKTKAYYIIIDEDQKNYVEYAYGSSENPFGAGRYLHPHQGFMIIVSDSDRSAKFDNRMRNTTATSGFRDEQPRYPLVNLFATDGNGNRDMVTVELGRPDKGGAPKQQALRTSSCSLWCRYEDEDYALVFTQPGLEYANIRFAADEDAEFTMTWSTHNGEFSYLHLIDNMTGADIDCLSTSEYKFSARESDYNSRFRLVFDYTGIDDHEVPEPVEGSATFAYYANGEIHLTDADDDASLQIIDMTGRVIVSRDGVHTVSTTGLAAGVYVLRLTTANGTRIQKIVLN